MKNQFRLFLYSPGDQLMESLQLTVVDLEKLAHIVFHRDGARFDMGHRHDLELSI